MKDLIQKFIATLNEDGVLSEGQIKTFEDFGAVIESKITEAAKEAKDDAEEKATTDEEEKEDEMEESIKRILAKLDEVKEKEIKLAICQFRETQDLTFKEGHVVDSISKYLDEALEQHLPEQAIVDYAKMDRLENTINAIRESVIVTDDQVQSKISSTLESIQEELTQKSELLDSAVRRNIDYKSKLNTIQAETTLTEKLEDVPEYEAKQLQKQFAESTAEEIEEQFAETLKNIRAKEYDIEREDPIKETITETETFETHENDIDRYARLAERWLPSTAE